MFWRICLRVWMVPDPSWANPQWITPDMQLSAGNNALFMLPAVLCTSQEYVVAVHFPACDRKKSSPRVFAPKRSTTAIRAWDGKSFWKARSSGTLRTALRSTAHWFSAVFLSMQARGTGISVVMNLYTMSRLDTKKPTEARVG